MKNYMKSKVTGTTNNGIDLFNREDLKYYYLSKKRHEIFYNDFKGIINYKYLTLIKGESLSLYEYGKLGRRKSSDIDLLIPREEIQLIENNLQKTGYLPTCTCEYNRKSKIFCLSSSHQLPSFLKVENNIKVEVDVNFDLFWGEYTGKRIDVGEFLENNFCKQNIYGLDFNVLTPLNSLIQLILHHYKEMNSIFHLIKHNTINYAMFNDIYRLLINNKTICVNSVYELCKKYDIMPFAYYIFYYTNEIFKDDYIRSFVNKTYNCYGRELLDCYGLSERERKHWNVDFKERLNSINIYDLIKSDLSKNDLIKNGINSNIFG